VCSSLKTHVSAEVKGSGCIPDGVDINEALCRFDEFAIAFNRRFGASLHRGPGPYLDNDSIHYGFRNDKVDVYISIDKCRPSSGKGRSRRVAFSVEDLSAKRTLREEGSVQVKE
jgi:hypothetical protein